jgi:hypothetical protein
MIVPVPPQGGIFDFQALDNLPRRLTNDFKRKMREGVILPWPKPRHCSILFPEPRFGSSEARAYGSLRRVASDISISRRALQ